MAGNTPQAPVVEGRRARKRREMHRHIFENAREMFLERGFEETTVEQLADRCDIAQATFFNHFPSKEHVLHEMAEEVFGHFRELILFEATRKAPVSSRLRGIAERAAALVQRAPELTRRVLLSMLHTASSGDSGKRLAGIHEVMADLLRSGQERGEIRRDTDAEVLAEIPVSIMVGAMTQWIHDPSYPLADRLEVQSRLASELLKATGPDASGPDASGPDIPAPDAPAPGITELKSTEPGSGRNNATEPPASGGG